jgi:serine protease AprX
MKTLPMLMLGASLLMAGPGANKPPGHKTSPDLSSGNSNTPTAVIVQFRTPPTASELQGFGPSAKVIRSFDAIQAVHVVLPPAIISVLEADPNVLYISPDRPVNKSLDITVQTVNGDLPGNAKYNGAGVGVAVIDSGISAHPDLGPRIVYSQSFASDEATPSDLYGHGTHVAGIIASSGARSTGPNFSRTFEGVAPNVNLINLKALDQTGSGQESDVIAAIQATIQLQSTYNIRVLNLSLGSPVFESYTLDPLCQAVEAAWKAGIVVVVAAATTGAMAMAPSHRPATIPT